MVTLASSSNWSLLTYSLVHAVTSVVLRLRQYMTESNPIQVNLELNVASHMQQ